MHCRFGKHEQEENSCSLSAAGKSHFGIGILL